ncbi:hypothetical protein [Oceaniferula spumae]
MKTKLISFGVLLIFTLSAFSEEADEKWKWYEDSHYVVLSGLKNKLIITVKGGVLTQNQIHKRVRQDPKSILEALVFKGASHTRVLFGTDPRKKKVTFQETRVTKGVFEVSSEGKTYKIKVIDLLKHGDVDMAELEELFGANAVEAKKK